MQRSLQGQTAYSVFPVTNYSFGAKAPKTEKDSHVGERLARMRAKFEREGTRRSVEGIILVNQHNHPHVLMLQVGTSFFRLPGGRLRPGEDEAEGLRRKLGNNLAPDNIMLAPHWEVGECAGTYWRPNFDTVFYPYLPPHITRAKEVKKLFMVPLPEKCFFGVPKNYKLIAVPLFELYENVARFGPVMATIPAMLSRFRLNLVSSIPVPMPPPPGGGTQAQQQAQQQQQQQLQAGFALQMVH